MWSGLLLVAFVALGSASPIIFSSPISTGGRPLVSVLAVPEARARLVTEIEGLMDGMNLPCKDGIRTTMFVALMHFEGRRVAMETARFKAMEVMPLMAKLDMKTAERLTAAIERLYKEVLELPVSEGYEWGIESPKHSVVKTFIQTFLTLERTLRETPETLTVEEMKRTLTTVMSELKGLSDCSGLISSEEATTECERVMTRFITPTHMETCFRTLEGELREIIRDPVMLNYIRDTLETMATKSVAYTAYMMTSLNTLIHSGTRPTEILVNWLYTVSTMTFLGKPESMRYPYARLPYPSSSSSSHRFPSWFPSSYPSRFPSSYPSSRFPSSYPSSRFPSSYPSSRFPSSYPSSRFPSSYPSSRFPSSFIKSWESFPFMESPIASAYPYSLPISSLPYPSPFPTHFMDSRPIPSNMAHLASELSYAPYLFALGSGHPLRVREDLKSVMNTVDMVRSINLPSPADPCFSQKLAAFNAVLLTVLNSVDYLVIKSTLSQMLKEVSYGAANMGYSSGSSIHELLTSPENEVISRILGKELIKPELMAIERLYNIPELRPILSHHYALLSSVSNAPAHVAPKMIAAVLKGVAEMIRTDEALCRIDVTRVVPQIEEVLSTIAASLSWSNVEYKLVAGLRKCMAMKGIEGIPEAEIIEIISKVKPVYLFHLRHHGNILSSLISHLREGRASPDTVADMLIAMEEINMAAETVNRAPFERMRSEIPSSEGYRWPINMAAEMDKLPIERIWGERSFVKASRGSQASRWPVPWGQLARKLNHIYNKY